MPAPAMPTVELRILDPRLHDWGAPAYATDWSAGVDLRACLAEPLALTPGGPAVLVPTGIALAMDRPDMVALAVPRSGLGHRHGLILGQCVGTIDADYHGEILLSLWLRPDRPAYTVHPGDRVAQLVFMPILRPTFATVDAFTTATARGAAGFGSTGVA